VIIKISFFQRNLWFILRLIVLMRIGWLIYQVEKLEFSWEMKEMNNFEQFRQIWQINWKCSGQAEYEREFSDSFNHVLFRKFWNQQEEIFSKWYFSIFTCIHQILKKNFSHCWHLQEKTFGIQQDKDDHFNDTSHKWAHLRVALNQSAMFRVQISLINQEK